MPMLRNVPRNMIRAAPVLLAGLVVVGDASGVEPVDFRREVAPILEQHCLRCHQPANRKGKLSLATFDDLDAGAHVVPGRPDESPLLELVTPPGPNRRPEMPREGTPLTTAQVEVLGRWIADGAAWPREVVLRPAVRTDPAWWSLRPLSGAGPPALPGHDVPPGWDENPIDRFILAKLMENGLCPSPRADRRRLIRRLTYDLTGLPPTPEEVAAFERDDSPAAYLAVVDRLLSSPHHGEHWGRHWLDVVRFGESTGFERNVLIDNAWPYRDHVIGSFNDDKPFDRFVLEQIAGDVIGAGDPAVEAGTGFLVCGAYDNVKNKDPVLNASIRADTIDDMIRATSETFLGLTVGCARCHDHKFDPIPQRDYYGLAATFAGVEHASRVVATPEARRAYETRAASLRAEQARLTSERLGLEKDIVARGERGARADEEGWVRPPASAGGTEETFPPVEARFVRLVVSGRQDNPALTTGYGIDEFEVWTAGEPARNVALADAGGRATGVSRVAQDFTEAYDVKLTNDGRHGAAWIAFGPELVMTLAQPERIGRVVFSSFRADDDAPAASRIPFVGDYAIEVSRDGASWTEVASSRDRRPMTPAWRRKRLLERATTEAERSRLAALTSHLESVQRQLAAIPAPPSWWVGAFRDVDGPTYLFLGGDPQRKGEQVVPASLSALGAATAGYALPASARESDRRLALARWLVDRSQPLTPRVLANRIWHYHFGTGLVATPSDFGALGSRPTHPELLDWLAGEVQRQGWRLKAIHRLIVTSQAYQQAGDYRAEAARRDGESRLLWRFPPRRLSAEEVRDTLLEIAGRLDRRMGGPGFRLYRYLEDNVATYVPLDVHGPETYRRGVYHQNARASLADVLSDFDCPDPASAAPRRAATTTPLQALTLMNHRFTFDMAGAWAGRLAREAGEDPEAQARRAFLQAFARPAEAEELRLAVALIGRHGLRAFCRALLNSNELIAID
jgi:hypothetical protein